MQRAKCISVIYDSIVINVVDSCPGEPVGVLRSSGLSVSQKQPWQGWVSLHPVPTAVMAVRQGLLLQPAIELQWMVGSLERVCRILGTGQGELVGICLFTQQMLLCAGLGADC